MFNSFCKKTFIFLMGILLLLACSSSNSSQTNDSPTKPATASFSNIVISTPAVVPVFSGSATSAGIFIHNFGSEQIKSITVSSPSHKTSFNSFFTRLFKGASIKDLEILGYGDAFASTNNAFSLDGGSRDLCMSSLDEGNGASCYLKFTTPEVQDPFENDYVILTVNTNKGKEYNQIISWEAVASLGNSGDGGFFTKMPSSVSYGGYATGYMYVGSNKGDIDILKLKLNVEPEGTAYVVGGYTPDMEVSSGDIIAFEVKLLQPNSSAKSINGGSSQITLNSYFKSLDGYVFPTAQLNLTATFSSVANLVGGNIPVLFKNPASGLQTSYTAALVNNGNESAISLSVSVTSGGAYASITANTCSGTLASGATCTFTITPTIANIVNGQSYPVTIGYSYTGPSGGTYPLESTQFIVVGNGNVGAYVSFTVPGSQIIGVGGESVTFPISVFNSSVSAESLTNISYAVTSSSNVVTMTTPSTTCGATLSPGSSCVINIKMVSGATPGIGDVFESFIYNTPNVLTFSKSILFVPFRVTSVPVFVFESSSAFLGLTGQSLTESVSLSFRLKNTGTGPGLYSLVDRTPTTFTGFNLISTTCSTGTEVALNKNESCLINIRFGPLPSIESSVRIVSQLYSVVYTNPTSMPVESYLSTAIIGYQVYGQLASLGLISIESFPAQSGGIGSIASPMAYTGGANSGGLQRLKLVYRNLSPLYRITNQVFNLTTLSPFYSVNTGLTTCGYESRTAVVVATIESGGTFSCDLVLDINRFTVGLFATNSGVTDIGFKLPLSTWRAGGESGFLPESQAKYLVTGESMFTGTYQSAVITTNATASSGNWATTTFNQTLTNGLGYPTIVNKATYASNLWGYTLVAGANCPTVSINAPFESAQLFESVTCTYTVGSGSTATGNWTLNIIEPAGVIRDELKLTTYVSESNNLPAIPIVYNPLRYLFTRN